MINSEMEQHSTSGGGREFTAWFVALEQSVVTFVLGGRERGLGDLLQDLLQEVGLGQVFVKL